MKPLGKDRLNQLRLTAHISLWGRVPSCLRSVSLGVGDIEIQFRCYFDSPPTDAEIDLLKAAGEEISYCGPKLFSFQEDFRVLPSPSKMEHLSELIFLRYEPN